MDLLALAFSVFAASASVGCLVYLHRARAATIRAADRAREAADRATLHADRAVAALRTTQRGG